MYHSGGGLIVPFFVSQTLYKTPPQVSPPLSIRKLIRGEGTQQGFLSPPESEANVEGKGREDRGQKP